jgi:hypothetical protein
LNHFIPKYENRTVKLVEIVSRTGEDDEDGGRWR